MKFRFVSLFGVVCYFSGPVVFGLDDFDSEPEIYSEISQQAQQKAIKYDGIHLLGGINYLAPSFTSSIVGNNVEAKKNMNRLCLAVGADWSKRIKGNFLLGINAILNMGKSKKLSDQNEEVKADWLTPDFNLRLGYIIPKYTMDVFVQAGITKISGKYRMSNGNEVDASKFVPQFGIGFEKQINKKFGIRFDTDFSLNKKVNKLINGTSYRIKLKQNQFRLMGTLRISDMGEH